MASVTWCDCAPNSAWSACSIRTATAAPGGPLSAPASGRSRRAISPTRGRMSAVWSWWFKSNQRSCCDKASLSSPIYPRARMVVTACSRFIAAVTRWRRRSRATKSCRHCACSPLKSCTPYAPTWSASVAMAGARGACVSAYSRPPPGCTARDRGWTSSSSAASRRSGKSYSTASNAGRLYPLSQHR